MRQNFVSRNCRNFAAFEGSPHENGYNSETKSRKMLPKVPKRPERRGLGPYSKKPKFLGQIFFWPFLAFFGHFLTVFGPVGIEKTIFVKSVFSKHCFYWSKRKKNLQPKSQIQKKIFLKHSSTHVYEYFNLVMNIYFREGVHKSWKFMVRLTVRVDPLPPFPD